LRCITPEVRQEWVETNFATLVSGEDGFGHFQPEAMLQATMHPNAVT
jgi:hypothetical protein